MLGPTERVTNGRCFVGARRLNEGVRDFVKENWGNAANFFYHLGCVARKVPAQRLQNAARMLQSRIPLRKAQLVGPFVEPGFAIEGSCLRIPARKEAA